MFFIAQASALASQLRMCEWPRVPFLCGPFKGFEAQRAHWCLVTGLYSSVGTLRPHLHIM